jgi:hypothetical protein
MPTHSGRARSILTIAALVAAGCTASGPDDGAPPSPDLGSPPSPDAATQPDLAQQDQGGTSMATFVPGVFALLSKDRPADPALLQNPSVAGLAVRSAWSTLEPSDGTFDWSYLDGQVSAAKAAGKHVSIAVSAPDTPQWVYDAGAKAIPLIDPNPNHSTYGQLFNIPVPWDPIFLDRWTKFLAAFGARYGNEPTVAYVRGATESVTNGWGFPGVDANNQPLTIYGYTPDKEVMALETVVDATMSAFPHTPLWAEVGSVKDITDLMVPNQDYFGDQIAAYGFQKYPDRFGVWREDLSDCTANPPKMGGWAILAANPGKSGAQMLWDVQDGPPTYRMDACMKASPDDHPTVLQYAVNVGVSLGLIYVEIYGSDILDPSTAPALVYGAQNLK